MNMPTLAQQVQQQIVLSIGLSPEEKQALLGKLPALSEAQLGQLQAIFQEEQQRKEQMLGEFFEKNPELFPNYDRLSKHQVQQIYRGVEDHEKRDEQQRLEQLISSTY